MNFCLLITICFAIQSSLAGKCGEDERKIIHACRKSSVFMTIKNHLLLEWKSQEIGQQRNVSNSSSPTFRPLTNGSYQWLKDGMRVQDLHDGVQIMQDPHNHENWTMKLVCGRHSGNYSLRYHYEKMVSGKIRNESACLTYFALEVEETILRGISPLTISSNINDRVVLIVKAFKPGKVVWYFNGEFLPQTNLSKHFKFPDCKHYGITYGAVLQIRDIRLRHTGEYRLVYNVSGCIRHHKIFVEVLEKKKKGLDIFNIDDVSNHIFISDKEEAWEKRKAHHGRMFGFVILFVLGLFVFVAVVGSLAFLAICIYKKWFSGKTKNIKRGSLLPNIRLLFLRLFSFQPTYKEVPRAIDLLEDVKPDLSDIEENCKKDCETNCDNKKYSVDGGVKTLDEEVVDIN